ncbi:hypothetical protein BLNAU_24264 [Blattamonas nauphoetae]|uniref:Uncharacterized protein n=1 Tax=Blattamonas nauphoetae TaxID=2049346 RepID=A0ABQ9WMX3_9EUKA|nr:hypothetical protein BLNAU_24264 [Blattamonas nauphoetae]
MLLHSGIGCHIPLNSMPSLPIQSIGKSVTPLQEDVHFLSNVTGFDVLVSHSLNTEPIIRIGENSDRRDELLSIKVPTERFYPPRLDTVRVQRRSLLLFSLNMSTLDGTTRTGLEKFKPIGSPIPPFYVSDIVENTENLWNDGIEEVFSHTSDSVSVQSTSVAHYTLYIDCGRQPQQTMNWLESWWMMTVDNEYDWLCWLWMTRSWFSEKIDDECWKVEQMLREAIPRMNALMACLGRETEKTSLLVAPEPPKVQTDQTLASCPSPLHFSNRQSDDGWDLVGTGREIPTQAILSRMKAIDLNNKKQSENKRGGTNQ